MRTAFALVAAAGLAAAQGPPSYGAVTQISDGQIQAPESTAEAPPAPYSYYSAPPESTVEAVSSAVETPSVYVPPATTWTAAPVKSVVTSTAVVWSTVTAAPPPAISTVAAVSSASPAPVPVSTVEAVSSVKPIYPVPANSTVLATGTGAPVPTQAPINAAAGLQARLGAAAAGLIGLFAFLA